MLEKEEPQGTWWQWALELISSEAEGWQQQTPVCTNTHTHTHTDTRWGKAVKSV